MRFKDLSIKVKFILLFLVGIFILLIPSIITLDLTIKHEAEEAAVTKAKADLNTGYAILEEKYPGDWEMKGSTLYKGDTPFNTNYKLVDYIGGLTGDIVTIFANDKRLVTNLKIDGERAVGTAVSDTVFETVLKNGQDYYGEADVAGRMYQTAYTPIKNKNNEIVGIWSVATSKEFVNNITNTTYKKLSSILAIVLVIMIPIIYFSSKIISDPITELSRIINRLASYDLSFDENSKALAYLTRKDEIGEITKSLATMQENLIKLINNIKEVSGQVAASSEELSASGEQVARTSEQVGSAIQNVASGAEEQSAQIEETNSNIEVMVGQIMTVNSDSDTMISSAKSVMDQIDIGNQAVNKSIKEINNVKNDTGEVAGIIQSLGKASDEIGGIIEIINGIANQTNLLALNAAIEAARAGESGRGFSVVADEIRELAEESTESTEQIAALIKQIQVDVGKAVDKMDRNTDTVNSSVESIEKNRQIFNDIEQVARELMTLINGVKENTGELTQNSDKIADAINNVAAVSEEAAGNAEEVAASSEEQIASTEEIVSGARTLAEMADELTRQVDRFKLN